MTHKHGVWILIIINHILAIIGIYYSSIEWYPFILFGFILFGKLGSEIGNHRYVAHRSFKTGPIRHFILSTFGMFNCYGSTMSWVVAHRHHHTYSDKEQDPHSPHIIHWTKVWLTFWNPIKINMRDYIDLMRDSIYKLGHQYYFLIIGLTFMLLFLIDWRLPIFFISIPAVITLHGASLVNVVCHKWGYVNYDTNDQSKNNTLVNDITLGSGLHNNHHNDPGNYDENVTGTERDYCGWFIKNYLKI